MPHLGLYTAKGDCLAHVTVKDDDVDGAHVKLLLNLVKRSEMELKITEARPRVNGKR